MKSRLLYLLVLALTGLALLASPVSGASSGRFYSVNSDGTLYLSGDNYTLVHDNTTGIVEYTTTVVRVGQDNTTGIYSVWRPVFFFDTQELPEGATISSAFVTFRGKANHSDSDFNMVLVQPGDMHSPLEVDDYGAMYSKTTALNETFSTAAYASSMELALNSEGMAAIMTNGITVFGLRSSFDIAGTAPAGTEYVDLYSSESPYPPVLTVNYYLEVYLDAPDTKDLTSVAIFNGYYEDGDQLYVLRSNINYASGIAGLESSDYYSVQLRASDNILASVPLWSWGYVPASIYLSAGNALPVGTYTLIIIGNEDKFITDIPYVAHTIDNTEYKGTDLSALDSWVFSTAMDIGRVSQDGPDYYFTQVAGKAVLNDEGGDMLISGVPLLDAIRGHLFANPSLRPGETVPGGTSYEGTLWDNWGPSFTSDWDLIGEIGNVSGIVAASLAWLALGALVVIEVQKETGKPALGMIPAVGVLLLGSLFGVPLFIILGCTAIAAAYFYQQIILGGQG